MRSILIILIGVIRVSPGMFNKNSCRMCGSILTPSALCKICKESVKWTCYKCNKIEEVKHSDYYYNLDGQKVRIRIRRSNWIWDDHKQMNVTDLDSTIQIDAKLCGSFQRRRLHIQSWIIIIRFTLTRRI